MIYTLDIEQRFTYVNSKVEAWGYRKDDLLGRPYLSLLSKRHRGRRLKSTLDIGAKQVYEVEVVTRMGEVRSVMVSVSPLQGVDGEILGVLGIARDMTDTKKLEQQIRNSEKLASVGKLAAGVAHEINNPLGGIFNCLYNLRKGTLSPARQEEYWASMEDGVRRVQKIVRQLLDFSQQHEPDSAPTDINQIVDRVLVLDNSSLCPQSDPAGNSARSRAAEPHGRSAHDRAGADEFDFERRAGDERRRRADDPDHPWPKASAESR